MATDFDDQDGRREPHQPANPTEPPPDADVTAPIDRVAALLNVPFPERIGAYRIIGVLGRGGMGMVYRAEQQNPRREVALKVIGLSFVTAELVRRFDLEVQTLGRLKHPGIAQVYDAGLTPTEYGQQPFFAMELVESGVPLDLFAIQKKMSLRQRLELFTKVCDAVQYAHQQGVIHRDLKPDNIIVTPDGNPKILDFGVARATDSDVKATTLHTDVGQVIGTLPYMSPEQAGGKSDEVDTRSDVYALGVIAYQLLTGRMPYDVAKRALAEAVRIIQEEEPSRLSSINKTFRGDIETIVGKALAKEKERRYATVSDLAADIRRHLADEPITARPAGTWYQVEKFAKRNRVLVGGVAATFLAIGTGLVVSLALLAKAESQRRIAENQTIAAEQQRAEAEHQAAISHAVSQFQADMLLAADPDRLGGNNLTVVQVLQSAGNQLDAGRLSAMPLVEGTVRHVLGNSFGSLGRYDDAELHLRKAVALYSQTFDETSFDLLDCKGNLAACLGNLHNNIEADALFEHVTTQLQIHFPAKYKRRASIMSSQAVLWQREGRSAEAEALLRAALATLRRDPSAKQEEIAQITNNLTLALISQRKLAEAKVLVEESLAVIRKELPAEHPLISKLINNLASVYLEMGEKAAAEKLFREALAINKTSLPPDHPDNAVSMNNIALCLDFANSGKEIEELYREALRIHRKAFDDDHPRVAGSMQTLASFLLQARRLDEADYLIQEAIRIERRVLPANHPSLADALNMSAMILEARGRLPEAEAPYREALKIVKNALPVSDPKQGTCLLNLALLLRDLRQYPEAESLLVEAAESRKKEIPFDAKLMGDIQYFLAGVLALENKLDQAIPAVKDAIQTWSQVLPDEYTQMGMAYNTLAGMLLESGQLKDAEVAQIRVIEWRRKNLRHGDSRIASAQSVLGEILLGQGKLADAETLLLPSYNELAQDAGVPVDRLKRACNTVIKLYTAKQDERSAKYWRSVLTELEKRNPATNSAPNPK